MRTSTVALSFLASFAALVAGSSSTATIRQADASHHQKSKGSQLQQRYDMYVQSKEAMRDFHGLLEQDKVAMKKEHDELIKKVAAHELDASAPEVKLAAKKYRMAVWAVDDATQTMRQNMREIRSEMREAVGPAAFIQMMSTDSLMRPDAQAHYDPEHQVSKIYYISTNKVERLQFMQQQLNEKAPGIDAERFKATQVGAVQGRKETEFSNGKPSSFLQAISEKSKSSIVAEYVTNARLLQKIEDAALDDRPVLVLEDNAELSDDWAEQVDEALDEVPDDWHILKLGYSGEAASRDRVSGTKGIYKACCSDTPGSRYRGSQAFLVRPRAVKSILLGLKQRSLVDFDKAVLMSTVEPQAINTYAISKSIANSTNIGGPSRVLTARESRIAALVD